MLLDPKRKRALTIAMSAFIVPALLSGMVIWVHFSQATPIGCFQSIRYGWFLELEEYAKSHPDKKYPPMSSVPGQLFLDIKDMSPKFISNWGAPFCVATDSAYKKLSIEQQFADPTLAYFGYALCNEDELLAFLEEYPKFVESGADFDADLPAPAGRGSFGGDQFVRLTRDLDEQKEGLARSIPILFEIPDYSSGDPVSRHWNGMGIAIDISGNLKSTVFGAEFPMTEAVIEKIGEIKAKYAAGSSFAVVRTAISASPGDRIRGTTR